MKLKRKSGLTIGIIALSSTALMSVGFASWVLSTGDKAEVTGNLVVDSVDSKDHKILHIYDNSSSSDILSGGTSTQEIVFAGDNVAPSGTNYEWLTVNTQSSGYKAVNLTATFVVEINNITDASLVRTSVEVVEATTPGTYAFKKADNSTDVSTTADGGFAKAKEMELVNDLTVSQQYNGNAPTGYSATPNKNGKFITITVSATWGNRFGGDDQNPYTFYNAHKSTDEINDETFNIDGDNPKKLTYAEHANQCLNGLDALLEGVTYKLKITVYGSAAEIPTA